MTHTAKGQQIQRSGLATGHDVFPPPPRAFTAEATEVNRDPAQMENTILRNRSDMIEGA